MTRFFLSPAAMNGFTILLAGLIQIQGDIRMGDRVIRFNLADPMVLIGITALILAWIRGQLVGHLPKEIKRIFTQIAIIFFVILLGTLLTKIRYDEWMSWAIFNKTIGFLIIPCYFYMGFYITSLLTFEGQYKFITSFILVASLILIFYHLSIAYAWFSPVFDKKLEPIWLRVHTAVFGENGTSQYSGLVKNRNVLALSYVIIAAFVLVKYLERPKTRKGVQYNLIVFMTIFAGVTSKSFSYLVTMMCLFAVLAAFYNKDWVKQLVKLGIFLVVSFIFSEKSYDCARYACLSETFADIRASQSYQLADSLSSLTNLYKRSIDIRINLEKESSLVRWDNFSQAVNLWLSYPILGSGVGSFLLLASRNNEGFVYTIHNTALWFAAEMGVVGLFSILCFFIYVFLVLANFCGPETDKHKLLSARWGICIIICCALFSLVHEILYQRLIWISLGLIMGVLLPFRQADQRQNDIKSN